MPVFMRKQSERFAAQLNSPPLTWYLAFAGFTEGDDARIQTINQGAQGYKVHCARGKDVETVFHKYPFLFLLRFGHFLPDGIQEAFRFELVESVTGSLKMVSQRLRQALVEGGVFHIDYHGTIVSAGDLFSETEGFPPVAEECQSKHSQRRQSGQSTMAPRPDG